ncbi:MAG: hypothetical protein AAGC55_28330, partial [Myxococcota bacterium]
DRAGELLAAWIERHGRTARAQEIERRQLLLDYPRQPKLALDHIRDHLGLRFDHQRAALGEAPSYPTALADSDAFDLSNRRSLQARALAAARDLSGFTDCALDDMAALPLNSVRRRNLLQRISRPDHPGLMDWLVADLGESSSGGFGSLEIHRRLLPEQLRELARRRPEVGDHAEFVALRLRQVRPGPDVDWRGDTAEFQAYLERLWAVAEPLSAVFNSLKAHVLYHWLDFDRRHGRYDRARFVRYLSLPRRAYYAPIERLRHIQRIHLAEPSANYRRDTGLSAIGDDRALVDDYLRHFLRDAPDTRAFDSLVRDDILREALVCAKVFAGIGDEERWAALLGDPERYRALSERVDLELAPDNPRILGADDPVSLGVYVKNVRTLVVKVFEIDARNYYALHDRDIDTTIDLDGLVATHESTHTFAEPAIRRVLRRFDLPELSAPGVYVVEVIGAGKSSRALIRKGG